MLGVRGTGHVDMPQPKRPRTAATAAAAPDVEEAVDPTLRDTLEAEHRTAAEDVQKLTSLLNAAKRKRGWAQLRLNALTRKEMNERLGPEAKAKAKAKTKAKANAAP